MWLAQVERWSLRRMVALWIGGLVLQVALIGGPLWWAVSHATERRAAVQAVAEPMTAAVAAQKPVMAVAHPVVTQVATAV